MNGICENQGRCKKAASRDILPMATATAACPECGKPLKLIAPAAGGGGKGVRLVLVAVVLAVVAGGGAYFYMQDAPAQPRPSVASVAAPVTANLAPPAPSIAPSFPDTSGPVRSTPQAFDTSQPAVLSSTAAPVVVNAEPIRPIPPPSAADMVRPEPAPPIEATPPGQAAIAPPPVEPALVPAPVPAPAPPRPDIILTLRGSNTIGSELAPKLARAYLEQVGDSDVSVVRIEKVEDEVMVVGRRGDHQEAIYIAAHGSGTSAKGLAATKPGEMADIGMSSRRINPEERELLKDKGDMTAVTNEHVLGLDGLATIVNVQNPVSVLTIKQLRDIFSGAVTDWGDKSIGGTPGAIHIYARDSNSGTYDTFNALVLRGAKLRADAQRFEDSSTLSGAVDKDPGGIGFIGLPYVASNKALAVSENGASPIKPNRLTVATEDYALSRRLYLYTPATSPNPAVRRFIELALSPSGQKLVDETGFIALTIASEPVAHGPGTPPEYEALTKSAERLTTDFRFKFGSTDIDNRGQRDMRRLADYLANRRIAPGRLILVGFGDNVGAAAAVKKISEDRAKAVAALLKLEGITVGQVAGFGALLPVADNDTEQGREKNRRVEVFVRR